jgi:multiple sugar transport system ATP-binding protein
MATITLDNVTRDFGSTVAVDQLNLEVKDGEFVSLLGPSGCGKTTTLHMLVGLQTPTSGRVLFDGKPMDRVPPHKRNAGLIFQDYSVFPHLSPRANIEFGLRVRGASRATRRAEVARVAEIVELDDELLDRSTADLNAGQLQRVAIARTLITRPSIVLLDEPLSNLEPDLRARTRAKLKRLFRDLGQTTVYVTHDQVEAMSLSDRIAVMNFGVLQQYGTPEQVYVRSDNIFVAGFLGSPPMNFLHGRLTAADGALRIEGTGFTLELPASPTVEGAVGDSVTVGVRPERLAVEHSRGRMPSALEGSVYAIEPLGSETIVDVSVGDAVVRALLPPTADFHVEEPVSVLVDPVDVHLFNGKGQSVRSASRW